MAIDGKITSLTSLPAVDRANNVLEIVSSGASYKATPNFIMGITGNPVGTTDSQTLTNKTLTAPTVSSPVFSGTITGTYTIGGTPTFPSSVATLTGSQTLTNKTLTSPTINTPTITNASITADSITGFSTANSGTIYGLVITTGNLAYSALPTGTVVQVASTNYSAVATGTTLIPYDDTIPQITEGTEFMTQAITPRSATNILIIEAVAIHGSTAVGNLASALFQDSTANALAASNSYAETLSVMRISRVKYTMVAGTTSSTTFRYRAGNSAAGTVTFNGESGTRKYGGAILSHMQITEYKA